MFLEIVKDTVSKLKILTGREPASLGPHRRQRQADLLISRPAWSTQGVQTRQAFIAETVNQKGTPQKDVTIKSDAPDTLLLEKHADYIASYGSKKDDYEYCMSEYLRMSGIYWGLTVMDLMGQLHRMNREEILVFIKSCQHECGGVSASIGHDPHLLYTLSAVQILTLYDSINVIDVDKVVAYVQSLQKEDGSFAGDIWGPTKQLV